MNGFALNNSTFCSFWTLFKFELLALAFADLLCTLCEGFLTVSFLIDYIKECLNEFDWSWIYKVCIINEFTNCFWTKILGWVTDLCSFVASLFLDFFSRSRFCLSTSDSDSFKWINNSKTDYNHYFFILIKSTYRIGQQNFSWLRLGQVKRFRYCRIYFLNLVLSFKYFVL